MAKNLVVALFALGAVASACGTGAVRPGAQAATLPKLLVSPGGSDSGSCTQTAPCATLSRAYRVAQPGQIVELASGTYHAPALGPAPKAGGAHVVFRPAPGASVSFTGRFTLEGATHVTLQNLSLARTGANDRSLFVEACTSDITLDRVSGETFFILEGADRITFRGGSWGGYANAGEQDSAIGTSNATGPGRRCNGALAGPAHAITFDGVRFHDVFWNVPESAWGGAHPDCFEVNGFVDGLTIKNSRFERCASTFMQINGDQGDMTNVTFEGNTFSQLGGDTWYGIQITSSGKPGKCGNLVFRRNTYAPDNPNASTWPNGPLRTDCETLPGMKPVVVSRNIFLRGASETDCARYLGAPYVTAWTDNIFLQEPCGAAPRGVPYGFIFRGTRLAASGSAAVVRRIFDAAARGTSLAKVARDLNRSHLRPPAGTRWTAALIRGIVVDQVYAGGAYGAPGSNPALVKRATWRAAQKQAKKT